MIKWTTGSVGSEGRMRCSCGSAHREKQAPFGFANSRSFAPLTPQTQTRLLDPKRAGSQDDTAEGRGDSVDDRRGRMRMAPFMARAALSLGPSLLRVGGEYRGTYPRHRRS